MQLNGHASQTGTEITVGHQESNKDQEKMLNFNSKESNLPSSGSQFDTSRLKNARSGLNDAKASARSKEQLSIADATHTIPFPPEAMAQRLNSTRNENILNTTSSFPQPNSSHLNTQSNASRQQSVRNDLPQASQMSSSVEPMNKVKTRS
jgi:hypothetical protein